ncbi:hypothetical protein [Pontibacillus halophilus]|uniref:hypothetical protein n=1 Tax=Pontibacillus halophilus TaxID=516704 RepID=UPI00040F1297|nr:hypothetical protein [Pontibacillus halophilus]
MKPGMKIFTGVLTGVLLLAAIPTYDLLLKDRIDSAEVVVVKAGEEIQANDVISTDQLSVERRRKQDLVGDVVFAEDLQQILGKEAGELLISNSMVSMKSIDFEDIIPDPTKEEAIRPIVDDMIYAKPGSLRRKDKIDIYVVSKDYMVEESNQSAADDSNKASSEEEDEEKNEFNLQSYKEPLLEDIQVVYVKDSSNNEVTNKEDEQKAKEERLNATGNISDLEVILNEDDFQALMNEVVENGNKLYITYN